MNDSLIIGEITIETISRPTFSQLIMIGSTQTTKWCDWLYLSTGIIWANRDDLIGVQSSRCLNYIHILSPGRYNCQKYPTCVVRRDYRWDWIHWFIFCRLWFKNCVIVIALFWKKYKIAEYISAKLTTSISWVNSCVNVYYGIQNMFQGNTELTEPL